MVPQVSILMPVRNEARYLEDALASLFRQTLRDWELVVVDDGSTDSTPEILSQASRNDVRIRPIPQEGTGLVAALNAGLAASRAPLLARMDGDDISHPRRLELQANFLATHSEVDLVASHFRHFPRQDLKQGLISYEAWQNGLSDHELILRDLFVESPFVHPSIMMRRELLQRLGGYRATCWAEDYDLWLRLANAGARFARLPQTLFFWRDHPERATRTLDEYSQDAFRRCKLHHLLLGYLRDTTQVIIAGAGLEGRAWFRLLSEHGIAVSYWLEVDPRKIGRTLHGSPVLALDHLPAARPKMLVAIGVRGGREQFRQWGVQQRLQEGLDFICVS